MLSINMRIFKPVLLVAVLCCNRIGQCLPIANETSNVESPSSITPPYSSTDDHYDQRQNGTENYRIHVDGLIFVVAPAETLLLAAGAAGDNKPTLPVIDSMKPPPGKPEVDPKPSPVPKSAHRPGLRLANFLVPLLRRLQHE